ncbi:hypothetical protein FRC09_019924 [Ceratobasidium sp. 395]|nr:hypothetical protein FRC09_019924 [Ceratobasidium sp. 395]
MIKRIKRRIHRAGEKLDRLLKDNEPTIPSTRSLTTSNPALLHADASTQRLSDPNLLQSDPNDDVLRRDSAPIPAREIDQEQSATSPNPELVHAKSHPEQATATITAPQPGGDPALPLEANTSKLYTAWSGLKTLLSVLHESADAFGPLKSAVGGLLKWFEIHEDQVAAREEFQQLKIDLESVSLEIAGYISGAALPSMESSILRLSQEFEDEIRLVDRKTQRNALGGYVEATADADEILIRYRRIQRHLDAFALSASMKIWQIVDDQVTRSRLKELPNSPAAKYCSTESTESSNVGRNGCTPNTCVQVLEQLRSWTQDSQSRKVYWLNGMAGTGKTTIAYSLCSELEHTGQLAASFFCSRQLPSCRRVGLILPSIAYQLSLFSRPFRYELSEMLERNPDLHNRPVDKQFQSLIAGPLRKIKGQLQRDLVIVIDALDECEDADSVDRVLSALLVQVADLPIKLFLTSRPEPKILKHMESQQGERVRSELRLHELEQSVVQSDIYTYLAVELKELSLEPATIVKLTEQSGVLFVYASTVVRYLKYDDLTWSNERLEAITSASASPNRSHQRIDELYSTILKAALNDRDLECSERDNIIRVLHAVVCAQEPLSVDVLTGVLSLAKVESVRKALRPLSSILQVSKTTGLVTTLHKSFPDYLLDPTRSEDFHCDAKKQHFLLARICFNLIETTQPPFNICDLESSYVLDAEVPHLNDRVNESISGCLFYACCYWETHLELANDANRLMDGVFQLLSTRLFLWMEIMNLKQSMPTGVIMLSKLDLWLSRVQGTSIEARDLAHDAWRFANAIVSGPVRHMTPHIYISVLALWPRHRPLSRYRSDRFMGLAEASGTALDRRDAAPLATLNAPHEVLCVACSPDGARIICGCRNNTLCIWDAHTGQMIGEPLAVHTSSVQSVTFSPDSRHIVSGSSDGTIRIWNVYTSETLGKPLQGHIDWVRSVGYSPDGAHIVSGSDDRTVRIWDARTGQMLGQPMKGHTGYVYSVAYSPNGAYIVSGSQDKTIRVWDAQTGGLRGQPLEGHTGGINSVCYSPDGTCIASGSNDQTVRIWDAGTGHMLTGPLESHTARVWSVKFSPDGAHIISGSSDETVRMWDAGTGHMLGQPLRGHTDWLRSVTFSPDGLRIISGSHDETIRIWDAHRVDKTLTQPPEGHTGCVYRVACSPDGARIASGSADGTICIWDAYTGQMAGLPLNGHTGSVCSVAYSHDGRQIVSGSDDKTIRIWDVSSWQMVGQPLRGHTDCVWSVAFSPDGSRIASGSEDQTIRIWDAHTRQMVGQLLKGHTGTVTSVAFSPDGGRLVSGSGDLTICIWDANARQMMGQPLRGHTNWVRSVAYSPSGTYIVSGSDDTTIRIWDALTGEIVGQPLKGHTHWVMSVAYSPDGARIVSGSVDKTIRIWDAHTSRMIGRPLEGHTSDVRSVVYSPDGKHIISSSDDQTIGIWDVCVSPDLGKSSQDGSSLLHQSSPSSDLPGSISGNFGHLSRVYEPETLAGLPVLPNPLDTGAWTLSADGWVLSYDLRPLLWVPPELRDTLLRRGMEWIISTEGSWSLDLSETKFGTEWQQCYCP